MQELLLLKGNPSRRRGGKKRRSAAQRAATARMLAANRSKYRRNPAKKKSHKKRKSSAVSHVSAAPSKSGKRRRSFGGGSSMTRNLMGMVKNGAIAGGGALAVDVGMGLIAKFAPSMTNLTARTNPDGSTNYLYFATKLGLAAAMGMYGGRLTRYAPQMAGGAIAVTAYELMRGMMPQDGSIPLGSVGRMGWFNPGRVVSGGVNTQMGRVMNTGKILRLSPGITNSTTLRGVGAYARRGVNR